MYYINLQFSLQAHILKFSERKMKHLFVKKGSILEVIIRIKVLYKQ